MRLLFLAGIFSLLTGCVTTGSGTAVEQIKDTNKAVDGQNHPQATNVSTQAKKNKPKPERQTELTGEVLYYLLSAEVAAQRGNYGLSAALYTKAAAITHDPEVAKQATRTAYYTRNADLSVKAASIWHELEPDNLEARQVLAALLVSAGKTEEAVKHFEFILANTQSSEHQRFMLVASLLSKENDKLTALKVMQKLIATRQNNPSALYAYSQLAFLVGNLDDAANQIKKAIKLKPGWTEAYILQSSIFTRQGYTAHDLEVLQQTVSEQPDNAQLRMFYARKLVDAKQYEEATKQFNALIESDANNFEARYASGLLALQMNEPVLAEKHFSILLESNNRIPESQYYLAQSYELQNELDKALSWYKKVVNHEYAFESELRIANILARQGKLEEARLRLQNISPDSMDKELKVYIAEGELLNDAKRYDDALKLYNDALIQIPDNTRLLYARALTAEKLDKVAMAIKDLEMIIEREPNNAQVLNALGYTLVDRTKQLEKGLEYIQKAIKLSPDDAAILDSLGWAYYRLGQYDKALEYLQRAFKQLNDAEIAAHLGEVLWVAGEHSKAKEVWNAALQNSPKDDLLLNVMQKFSE